MLRSHKLGVWQEFQECWAEYDDGSGTIAPEQLQSLLIRTDPPLGLGRMATGRDVLKFVFNLDIPLVNGRVPFHRTVYELVRNVCETQIPEVCSDTAQHRLCEAASRTKNKHAELLHCIIFSRQCPDQHGYTYSTTEAQHKAAVHIGIPSACRPCRSQNSWHDQCRQIKLTPARTAFLVKTGRNEAADRPHDSQVLLISAGG